MFFSFGRCATGQLQLSDEASPNLEERLGDFSRKSTALKKTLDRFQGIEREKLFSSCVKVRHTQAKLDKYLVTKI